MVRVRDDRKIVQETKIAKRVSNQEHPIAPVQAFHSLNSRLPVESARGQKLSTLKDDALRLLFCRLALCRQIT